MNKQQQMVADFMRQFEQEVKTVPEIPSLEVQKLRVKLIAEELTELQDAFDANNLVEVADAGADLLYVVLGLFVACGLPAEAIFEEVHRSNMSKVDGYKRADGKWMKPDTWTPPNLGVIIDEAIISGLQKELQDE